MGSDRGRSEKTDYHKRAQYLMRSKDDFMRNFKKCQHLAHSRLHYVKQAAAERGAHGVVAIVWQ